MAKVQKKAAAKAPAKAKEAKTTKAAAVTAKSGAKQAAPAKRGGAAKYEQPGAPWWKRLPLPD